jgi:hypothetical protein
MTEGKGLLEKEKKEKEKKRPSINMRRPVLHRGSTESALMQAGIVTENTPTELGTGQTRYDTSSFQRWRLGYVHTGRDLWHGFKLDLL